MEKLHETMTYATSKQRERAQRHMLTNMWTRCCAQKRQTGKKPGKALLSREYARVRGRFIERKQPNPYGILKRTRVKFFRHACSVFERKVRIARREKRLRTAAYQLVVVLHFRRCFAHKALVILAQKRNIHIVVPGNKTFVTNGADRGSSIGVIVDMKFLTNPIEFTEDLRGHKLQMSQDLGIIVVLVAHRFHLSFMHENR